MIYSEKQYKLLETELKKLKKENELTKKENKLLKVQNKQKDEVIHDLDKNNYRGQCETLKIKRIIEVSSIAKDIYDRIKEYKDSKYAYTEEIDKLI